MLLAALRPHDTLHSGRAKLNPPPAESGTRSASSGALERLYSKLAPVYDLWGALTETRARRRALEVAALSPGEAMLEVAVGTGHFFTTLAAGGVAGRLVGIDLAEGMLRRARRRLGSVESKSAALCRADAVRLPFEPASFDLLFNFYMLDLLGESDFAKVLGEFQRVLRPQGRLVLLTMAVQARWLNAIWVGLYRLSPALVAGCRPVPVVAILEANRWRVELHERLSQSGFRSEVTLARPGGASQGP